MSGNINMVIIEGRIVRDPEFSKIQSGTSMCKFSLANNKYYYKNNQVQNDVSFFDFVSWGKLAESAALNIHKGVHVLITGEVRQSVYKTKAGENRSKIYILALEIKYLGKKGVETKRLYDSLNNTNETVRSDVEDSINIAI